MQLKPSARYSPILLSRLSSRTKDRHLQPAGARRPVSAVPQRPGPIRGMTGVLRANRGRWPHGTVSNLFTIPTLP